MALSTSLPSNTNLTAPERGQPLEVITMTRKDYVAIAKVFYDAREWAYKEWGTNNCSNGDSTDYYSAASSAIDHVEWYISKVFKNDNPRYDEMKFLEAGQPEQLELRFDD